VGDLESVSSWRTKRVGRCDHPSQKTNSAIQKYLHEICEDNLSHIYMMEKDSATTQLQRIACKMKTRNFRCFSSEI